MDADGKYERQAQRLALCPLTPLKKADRRFYPALLQSNHWRKRRLAVFKARGRECAYCGRPSRSIHHERYDLSVNPWDYDTYDLTPICKECHKQKHNK